jgi:hypothetical protein
LGGTYKWTGPNGWTGSTLQNAVRKANVLADGGNYSAVSTVNGCPSAPAVTNVVVKQTPTVTLATAKDSICEGETITFTPSNVAGVTYVWSGPASFTSSVKSPSISSATASNAGVYSLYVISTSNNCKSPTVNETIILKHNPVPFIYSNKGSDLCEGDTAILSVNDGNLFNWNSGETTQSIIVYQSGIYGVSVINTGCFARSTEFTINVVPLPDKPYITNVDGVLISSSSVGNKWYKDTTSVPNEVYQSFTPLQEGYYAVKVTNDQGCSNTSDLFLFQFSSVAINNINKSELKVFPNPTAGNATIAFNLAKSAKVKAELYNLLGQKIETFIDEKKDSGKHSLQIDLSSIQLQQGIYNLLLNIDGEISTIKVSVVR